MLILEITVGHQPFSDHFQGFGQVCKFNLLGQIYYTVSVGKPMIVYNTFNNGQPISNPYFKLCTTTGTYKSNLCM